MYNHQPQLPISPFVAGSSGFSSDSTCSDTGSSTAGVSSLSSGTFSPSGGGSSFIMSSKYGVVEETSSSSSMPDEKSTKSPVSGEADSDIVKLKTPDLLYDTFKL